MPVARFARCRSALDFREPQFAKLYRRHGGGQPQSYLIYWG
nr:hypothetical protein HSTRRNID_HSTRRNID_CDS_0005 [Microvirus sp.]